MTFCDYVVSEPEYVFLTPISSPYGTKSTLLKGGRWNPDDYKGKYLLKMRRKVEKKSGNQEKTITKTNKQMKKHTNDFETHETSTLGQTEYMGSLPSFTLTT